MMSVLTNGPLLSSCDGTFEQNCDSSRDYTDITTLLEQQGATSTLDFMNTVHIVATYYQI